MYIQFNFERITTPLSVFIIIKTEKKTLMPAVTIPSINNYYSKDLPTEDETDKLIIKQINSINTRKKWQRFLEFFVLS